MKKSGGAGGKWTLVLEFLLIAILAAALVKPLFRAKYFDRWGSIESTFVADARFLKEHWPHPRWQPLWYCGTRYDYIYPPALRYGTAAVSSILGVIPVKAYHIYTAFFYCLGIAGVYLLVRLAGRSRMEGWIAAAATALLSPSFLFVPSIRNDYAIQVPWRLAVLLRYGEGPHITAVAWIPFALAFTWAALHKGRPLAFAAAAVSCAMVVSNNFYGATALAMFYPVLVWSLWITRQDNRIWLRALAVPALAYGLASFWLVPSYLLITLSNMKYVSAKGNLWSLWIMVAAAVAFILATNKLARGKPERAYPVFVTGSLVVFALNVLGHYAIEFRLMGEPTRLVPELDMVLILAAVEGLRQLWRFRQRWVKWPARAAAVAVVIVSFWTARGYLANMWTLYPLSEYKDRVEYRIQDWMARNMPGSRALAAGSVRFWYDAWNDLPQIGGGSEQGVQHDFVMPAQWQILLGDNAEMATNWLLSLGADAVIINDKHSREMYHDYAFPKKFAGVLPVAYDDGEGNTIYRVPRRFPGLARVVERSRMETLRPPKTDYDNEALKAYVVAVEQGPDAPATAEWHGSDAMTVRAKTAPGQAVLVQVTHDTAWRAYSGDTRLAVRRDPMDFMLIETPPGEHEIRLVFELPRENMAGRTLAGLSGLAVLGLAIVDLRRRRVAPVAEHAEKKRP